MNLSKRLQNLPQITRTNETLEYELVKGYCVAGLPFESGDLLALRVWNEADFGPFVSVWHQTPEGKWYLYNDGPYLETTCKRYWGEGAEACSLNNIQVEWTDANTLKITMNEPALEWTMTLRQNTFLKMLNPISSLMPEWTWKPIWLRRVRKILVKRVLGMGDIKVSFVPPSGHDSLFMLEQVYLFENATAILDGKDLGSPTILEQNPKMGNVALPRKGLFAIGEGRAVISDQAEYLTTKEKALSAANSKIDLVAL